METVYMICAAVGSTLIVCQFLVTILGLGAHHDMGGNDGGAHDMMGDHAGGHDAAGHHEAGHGSESSWFLSRLTFRTVTAAFAFFGLTGLSCIRFEMDPMAGLVMALGAGSLAFLLVGWLMQQMVKLNVDGTVHIERSLGSPGTVYLSIPGAKGGVGKVHVNFLNRTIEYKAITSQEQLPTGTKIVVVNIVSADTVEVAPATNSERTVHA